jgi:hypothetical protein
MAMSSKTVPCPECTAQVILAPKAGNPLRLVAFHNCCGKPMREVYETDAPDWPPPLLQDRLQPAEKIQPAKQKRS